MTTDPNAIVTRELLAMHSTLLGVQTSLVRQEGLQGQLVSRLDQLDGLLKDHELRLRSLEASRNEYQGVSRTAMGAVSIGVSLLSGSVLYVLQKLFGG